MILILFGPPGSGKGTQSALLAGHLNLTAISTGAILREAIKNKTALGMAAADYMKKGTLVPDDVITAVVADRLRRPDCDRGYILDGYPRTLGQAQSLKQLLTDRSEELSAVLNLEVEKAELVRRMQSRNRADDDGDIIRERLVVYENQTKPLIVFYKNEGVLETIAGIGSVDDIFGRILKAVQKENRTHDHIKIASGN